jgi:hypothetical protein
MDFHTARTVSSGASWGDVENAVGVVGADAQMHRLQATEHQRREAEQVADLLQIVQLVRGHDAVGGGDMKEAVEHVLQQGSGNRRSAWPGGGRSSRSRASSGAPACTGA